LVDAKVETEEEEKEEVKKVKGAGTPNRLGIPGNGKKLKAKQAYCPSFSTMYRART
jgi:hypothetical protein